MEIILYYLDRPKSNDIRRKRQKRKQVDDRGRDLSDVTTSQIMPTNTRSWKRQRMDSLLEPPDRAWPTDTLILDPWPLEL